jgi:hypothetical protein
MHATGVAGAQLPRPSQWLVGPLINAPVQVMVTLQLAATSASAHPPAPLHLPVLPHGAPGGQAAGVVTRGVLPAGIPEHMPTLPVTRQLLQPSVHAASQHTPSPEQMLLVQSPFAAQA